MNHSLTQLLSLTHKKTGAFVGCGGKTTIIRLLAAENKQRKVLVSTTTKMYPLDTTEATVYDSLEACFGCVPAVGIQCMGLGNPNTGKLEALPSAALAEIVPAYDLSLLEADGSRGLPCKGWLESEPVVPQYCTHTIGVVTLAALGKPATQAQVQRLDAFCRTTQIQPGERITLAALTQMVCSPQGMLKNSVGRRCLIVNQVEDSQTAQVALGWLHGLKTQYPDFFTHLVLGSAHQNLWRSV